MLTSPILDRPEVTTLDGLNSLAQSRGWSIRGDASGRYYLPDTAGLYSLWRASAGTGIPSRSAMTLRLLRPYLKLITLHERVRGECGTRRYRTRLMGGDVAESVGDGTGKFYEEFLSPAAAQLWYALSDVTLGHRYPVRILLTGEVFDRPSLVGEICSAPLLTEDGRADLIISVGRFNSLWRWDDILAHWRAEMAA